MHELSSSSDNDVLASLPRHQFLRKRGCAAVVIISSTFGAKEMERGRLQVQDLHDAVLR